MTIACPYCKHDLDIEEMIMDQDLLAAIKMLNSFGRHGALVCAYTELFGITPLKKYRRKWRVLLEEMKRLFDGESFSYDRRKYQISQAGIVEALNIVVHRHWTDHLENHNYLKKVMIPISAREGKDALKQADQDHKKKEAGLMSGSRSDPGTEFNSVPEDHASSWPAMKTLPDEPGFLSEEQIAENKRRLRELAAKIGG